jgi:hypothetical protein
MEFGKNLVFFIVFFIVLLTIVHSSRFAFLPRASVQILRLFAFVGQTDSWFRSKQS